MSAQVNGHMYRYRRDGESYRRGKGKGRKQGSGGDVQKEGGMKEEGQRERKNFYHSLWVIKSLDWIQKMPFKRLTSFISNTLAYGCNKQIGRNPKYSYTSLSSIFNRYKTELLFLSSLFFHLVILSSLYTI